MAQPHVEPEDVYHSKEQRPTIPAPRESLPPVGSSEPPEADVEDLDDDLTLLSCPKCARCEFCLGRHHVACPTCPDHYTRCPWCSTCTYCGGTNMVTPERAASYRPEPPPEAA